VRGHRGLLRAALPANWSILQGQLLKTSFEGILLLLTKGSFIIKTINLVLKVKAFSLLILHFLDLTKQLFSLENILA